MSCLYYSSPGVVNLSGQPWIVVIVAWSDSDTPHAHRIAVPFDFTQILPYVAVNKDAFPNSPADHAGRISHSACQNKHRFLAWLFKRNIRLSFALRSKQRSSLKPSRSI